MNALLTQLQTLNADGFFSRAARPADRTAQNRLPAMSCGGPQQDFTVIITVPTGRPHPQHQLCSNAEIAMGTRRPSRFYPWRLIVHVIPSHLVVRRSVRSHHPLEGTILSCVVTCMYRKTFSTAVKHTQVSLGAISIPISQSNLPNTVLIYNTFPGHCSPFWSSLAEGFFPSLSDSSPAIASNSSLCLSGCTSPNAFDHFQMTNSSHGGAYEPSLKPSMTCHCDTCTLSMLTIEIWLFPCVTDVQQNRVRIANVSVPWNTRGKCNDFATGQLVSGPLAVFCWWSMELLQTILIVMVW